MAARSGKMAWPVYDENDLLAEIKRLRRALGIRPSDEVPVVSESADHGMIRSGTGPDEVRK